MQYVMKCKFGKKSCRYKFSVYFWYFTLKFFNALIKLIIFYKNIFSRDCSGNFIVNDV
jgi:hypothetical protein